MARKWRAAWPVQWLAEWPAEWVDKWVDKWLAGWLEEWPVDPQERVLWTIIAQPPCPEVWVLKGVWVPPGRPAG